MSRLTLGAALGALALAVAPVAGVEAAEKTDQPSAEVLQACSAVKDQVLRGSRRFIGELDFRTSGVNWPEREAAAAEVLCVSEMMNRERCAGVGEGVSLKVRRSLARSGLDKDLVADTARYAGEAARHNCVVDAQIADSVEGPWVEKTIKF